MNKTGTLELSDEHLDCGEGTPCVPEIVVNQSTLAVTEGGMKTGDFDAYIADGILTVTGRYDYTREESWGVGACPQMNLAVVIPNISSSMPLLNITMGHGLLPETTSVLDPWIPVLLPDMGELNVTLDPAILFHGVYLSNWFGNITATGVRTTHLVANARQGNVSLTDVEAASVKVTASCSKEAWKKVTFSV